MKKRLLFLLTALALLLSACNLLPEANVTVPAATDTTIWAMDTRMELRLYGDRDDAVMTDLTSIINSLDQALSAVSSNSAVTALNESGRTDDVRIVSLVSEAQKISAQTDGALDITLYPVSRAWGFTTESYGIPPADELEALRDKVGMDKITLSEASVSLAEGTKLDFGALAKGYAADLCRRRMEDAELSGILSLGGNVQTVGSKPDGSAWVIGVQDPDDMEHYALTLELTGSKAVVTSGDYQRYFMQDSVRYCHILNPKTLSPVQGTLRSVTVVADTGLFADGLSTALFVMGREAGEAFWRQRGDFEAIWMEADGSVWITPGLTVTPGERPVYTVAR